MSTKLDPILRTIKYLFATFPSDIIIDFMKIQSEYIYSVKWLKR